MCSFPKQSAEARLKPCASVATGDPFIVKGQSLPNHAKVSAVFITLQAGEDKNRYDACLASPPTSPRDFKSKVLNCLTATRPSFNNIFTFDVCSISASAQGKPGSCAKGHSIEGCGLSATESKTLGSTRHVSVSWGLFWTRLCFS